MYMATFLTEEEKYGGALLLNQDGGIFLEPEIKLEFFEKLSLLNALYETK